MNVYIAAIQKEFLQEIEKGNGLYNLNQINILESYYYLRNKCDLILLLKKCNSFLLDSGAFTFLQSGKICDWDKYVEEYAAFINKYDIKLFFELDIDSIVGLKEVERLRNKLEFLTQKKPIVVWHKNRGKDYFLEMCNNYPYVALGGIVIKEIPKNIYEKAFPWFINEAHKRGTKIHCLGYTILEKLKKYKFDSVDSATWVHGNRCGFIYEFIEEKCYMKRLFKEKSRLKSQKAAFHNFFEFVKFSIYASKKL